MITTIISKNSVPIRLTVERWEHIVEEHGELSGLQADVLRTVADPTRILAGHEGALLATRQVETGKWLVVVYREPDDDGFIITAFLTRREGSLDRRKQLWP